MHYHVFNQGLSGRQSAMQWASREINNSGPYAASPLRYIGFTHIFILSFYIPTHFWKDIVLERGVGREQVGATIGAWAFWPHWGHLPDRQAQGPVGLIQHVTVRRLLQEYHREAQAPQ